VTAAPQAPQIGVTKQEIIIDLAGATTTDAEYQEQYSHKPGGAQHRNWQRIVSTR
jgi:hypothetical protein